MAVRGGVQHHLGVDPVYGGAQGAEGLEHRHQQNLPIGGEGHLVGEQFRLPHHFRPLQPQQVFRGPDHLPRGEAGLVQGQQKQQEEKQHPHPAEGPLPLGGKGFGSLHGPVTSSHGRGISVDRWTPGTSRETVRVSPGWRAGISADQ